jgi:hypothetical protein
MNCNTHGDTAAVAFCRTCGKPLCNQCTRDIRGVIYCETCLAARLDGTASAGFVPPQFPPQPQTPPQTGYQQFMDQGLGVKVQPGPASGPNPALAGILAGFFPIGVGAVYTGQYVKGLIHLVIMVMLLVGQSSDVPWFVHMVLGVGMGFFYIYQIIDSIRTARAIQMGEPAPDPFGLAQEFGAGERLDTAKVPTAAAVLIGLGAIFLLHTIGIFSFNVDRFWPLVLIALGVWLFAKHWGLLGNYRPTCVCERCRTRKLMGPAILITLGVVFLIGFERGWPAILLVIGVVKLMQSNASSEGHVGPFIPGATPPISPAPGSMPPGSGGFPTYVQPTPPGPASGSVAPGPTTSDPAASGSAPESTEPPASDEVKNV